jgi:hypothetical protein
VAKFKALDFKSRQQRHITGEEQEEEEEEKKKDTATLHRQE